jgi:hypothetical protein
MPGDSIPLKDVLQILDSGEEFSLSFVTCDKHKGKGGELITVERAVKHNWVSPKDRQLKQKLQPESTIILKHPRHYENSTRNIVLLVNGDIRKIHIRLIRKFNGKIVL